jgi:hypothetical protein
VIRVRKVLEGVCDGDSVENAESAGRSGERELVDRVRARGRQSVEALGSARMARKVEAAM